MRTELDHGVHRSVATSDSTVAQARTDGIDGDTRPLDVEGFIDARGFSRYQWLVMVLCFLVIAADGFDTAAIGYVGPALAREWGISKLSLGPLFSSALIGAAFGALIAGPLGDRFGRKRMLVSSVAAFGVLTLASALTSTVTELTVVRFLTGLGLGAAMPNAVTLLSEYSPARHRALLVNAMFCGFTLGSSSGGFASAWLITDYGWKIIFVIGGLIPILLVVAMGTLPESIRFLVAKGRADKRVTKILERIDPSVKITASSYAVPASDVGKTRSPIAILFAREYRVGSGLLWLTYFMGLVVYFVLTSWLPTLMSETGLTMRQAAVVTAVLSLGAGVGPLLLGWLMDLINPYVVVAAGFALSGVFVWLTGQVIGDAGALPWLIFITGVFLSGALTSMPAIAAAYYPTQGRASGVAWMLGIGRFGGIVGAIAGGPLLNAGYSVPFILGLLAIPAFLAAGSLLAKGALNRRSDRVRSVKAA